MVQLKSLMVGGDSCYCEQSQACHVLLGFLHFKTITSNPSASREKKHCSCLVSAAIITLCYRSQFFQVDLFRCHDLFMLCVSLAVTFIGWQTHIWEDDLWFALKSDFRFFCPALKDKIIHIKMNLSIERQSSGKYIAKVN